ncbi:recombinase family protein [Streptomyces sp. NBC_00201]|uniref:recombinase family protein n=1 Tax=Streptomyces sp. NBC_00201 TaxID=2975679 RepID=UPI00224D9BDC|nr:recombinase family protein [Streptomyces sp. NBC_00201]MCX5247150.1 recombinase family protein [Streptomyces sp. NBC_00201]
MLLREGDTLKVTRLARLSRSVRHLVTRGAELRERGIGLHVIEQGIDTAPMEGRAMFGMLSVLAQLQRELIVANTNDGLASARARERSAGAGRSSPRRGPGRPTAPRRAGEDRPTDRRHVWRPTIQVYGHLDKTRTAPRQPKKTAVTKP